MRSKVINAAEHICRINFNRAGKSYQRTVAINRIKPGIYTGHIATKGSKVTAIFTYNVHAMLYPLLISLTEGYALDEEEAVKSAEMLHEISRACLELEPEGIKLERALG